MRKELFGETATVYHHDGENWQRRVLKGVFWKEESVLHAQGGESGARAEVRMRVLFDGGASPAQAGDVLVKGEGPEIGAECGMEDIRREHICCIVHAVADNTGRAHLAHWRIDGK